MDANSDRRDGRRGNRRNMAQRIMDASLLNPERIVPPAGDPLPGELGRLQREPGQQHPITVPEALGVMRRKARYELAERYEGASHEQLAAAGLPPELEDQVPSRLPGWNEPMERRTLRMPSRVWAMLEARAEYLGVTLTAVLELEAFGLSEKDLPTPESFQNDYNRFYRETTAKERELARLDAKLPVSG